MLPSRISAACSFNRNNSQNIIRRGRAAAPFLSKMKPLKETISKVKDRIASLKGVFNTLKGTHRLVIVDDETLKESFSYKLTGINVFVGVGLSVILLIVITIIIIAFTPIREYIPGYANQDMVDQTYQNAHVIDSLEHVVENQEILIQNIQAALLGEEMAPESEIGATDTAKKVKPVNYTHSKADSMLRREVEALYQIKK